MKQIKSFEWRQLDDSLEKVTAEVNSEIRKLSQQSDVDIRITPTGNGLVYTLIYETKR